jgi:hypothetical protein
LSTAGHLCPDFKIPPCAFFVKAIDVLGRLALFFILRATESADSITAIAA